MFLMSLDITIRLGGGEGGVRFEGGNGMGSGLEREGI